MAGALSGKFRVDRLDGCHARIERQVAVDAMPGRTRVRRQRLAICERRADGINERREVTTWDDESVHLMSDQLRFVHSDGRVESKADYVKNLLAGDTAYTDVKTSAVEMMQVTPDSVVILGVQTMRKRLGPDWSEVTLRYLSVWRNEAGAWRMIAWQSARPSGNSVVPPKK